MTKTAPTTAEGKKKNYGTEAYERLCNFDEKQSVIDTQREIDKGYIAEIEECIRRNKGVIEKCGEDGVFIVVLLKKEELAPNTIRRYFVCRQTIPEPFYDQTVWRYNYKRGGDLEFIWVIPDRQTSMAMHGNPKLVEPEAQWLYSFVHKMYRGSLLKEAMKHFNIKEPETPEKLAMGT